MTDAEIAKAKAHYEYGITYDIFKEPVTSYAKTVLWAFEEINRQKAEIERLKNLESLERAIYNIAHGIGTNLQCEFASKEARDISYENAINKLVDIEIARKTVIKEFAERLKEEVAHIPAWGAVAKNKIDNHVKEMTEVNNHGERQ